MTAGHLLCLDAAVKPVLVSPLKSRIYFIINSRLLIVVEGLVSGLRIDRQSTILVPHEPYH